MASCRRNALRSPGTLAYYVYLITFYSFDIPDSFRRHALAGFPRSPREMWVWKRASRNLLLAADPKARYEKHEARRCSRCGRWCLGLQAQMMREREQYARTNNRLELQSWFPNQPDSLSIHPDRPVPPSL